MSEALNSPEAKSRRFRPYPKYKDSDVEWIDNIPSVWSVCPLFTVAREREEKNYGNLVQNVLSLSYGKIIDRDVTDNFGLLPESFETYQIIHEGNIILRLTDLQNDKRSLRVGLANHPGIITSAYICLELFRDIEPSYGYYLLHAYDITKVFYSFGGGVRQTMKFEDLKWLPILKPSRDEQCIIASFLDCETAKIDALIEKKERLIELLQEKRTALITQAVTKGLGPTVPMKDSGIEWLGKIPAHWEVRPLKNGFLFRKGRNAQVLTASYVKENLGPYPVYSGQTEEKGIMGFIDSFEYEFDEVLFSTTVGAKAMTPMTIKGRFSLSQNCLIMIPKGINPMPRFFYYQMHPSFSYERAGIPDYMQPSLRISDLMKHIMVFPPSNEQSEISSFLDCETAKIDALAAKIQDAIDRLKEYRTALISAAVSGKIDVRNLA